MTWNAGNKNVDTHYLLISFLCLFCKVTNCKTLNLDFHFLFVENMNKFVNEKLLLKFWNVIFSFNTGIMVTGIFSLNLR